MTFTSTVEQSALPQAKTRHISHLCNDCDMKGACDVRHDCAFFHQDVFVLEKEAVKLLKSTGSYRERRMRGRERQIGLCE